MKQTALIRIPHFLSLEKYYNNMEKLLYTGKKITYNKM